MILSGTCALAQTGLTAPEKPLLSVNFLKKEIHQKSGDLSFNVVRIINPTDNAVPIKPFLDLPQGWAMFSISFIDTIVPAHDSIALPFRIRIPEFASSDTTHDIVFKAYSGNNQLIASGSFFVQPDTHHNWDMVIPDKRAFIYPGKNFTEFEISLRNRGNTIENIDLKVDPGMHLSLMESPGENWREGMQVSLKPFVDTTIRVNINYTGDKERIFDLSRVQFSASAPDKSLYRGILVEKYSDIYAPFAVDRNLPHVTEVGVRTFLNNKQFLPFVKARGTQVFKNKSTLRYNFTLYDIAENEDLAGNLYYSFLYTWKNLKAGIGAFSSSLGRNLYSRNALMLSNKIQLAPVFSLEAFISQSITKPKTSVAVGYSFDRRIVNISGSVAFDSDRDREVNTGSVMFRSGLLPIFKNHQVMVNLYGYSEDHYANRDFSLLGFGWDIQYMAKFGRRLSLQLNNNFGSPNIPGPQMGLLVLTGEMKYSLANGKDFLSLEYDNSRRNYYTFNYEGVRQPNNYLKDQYGAFMYHSHSNKNHIWHAGPSAEVYNSRKPSTTYGGTYAEYSTQKFNLEYKGLIHSKLLIDIKTGFRQIYYLEQNEITEERFDFHMLGSYSFGYGYVMMARYDYGPIVGSGLYQFAGDTRNHSFTFGPQAMTYFLKGRMSFSLSTNFSYRFDLNYGSINLNPKLETYLYKDWYANISGTYSFNKQEYRETTVKSSHYYLEFSIKKRWGKSDIDKWQKDTKRLKVILFKDENGNGIKDYGEEGVPYVKTRIRLTNAPTYNPEDFFPVDITLLSNEGGVAVFNQLPVGYYELTISPLSDVKEYFYVDKGTEKLELSKTTVYYIPFQKSNKIMGRIDVRRQRFIKEGQESIDLTNIKVTAYNKSGNSYSSFTLADGSFTIFVPGKNDYYVRMPNVFGSSFKILNNDQRIFVSDTSLNFVEFNVVESSRQISFKQAKPQQADTVAKPLKIKVLHGKIYENPALDTVNAQATPQFNLKVPLSPAEKELVKGTFYTVVSDTLDREDALKVFRVFAENGISCFLGLDTLSEKYYVVTASFATENEAKKEIGRLKIAGIRDAQILQY